VGVGVKISVMVDIIFESHGTTYDNERHLASGWFDADLSPLGIKQAEELGERYRDQYFATVFCSDLRRSYRTAQIAFLDRSNVRIIRDQRLNECNYGDLNQQQSSQVDPEKINHIKIPFANGESYQQTAERMRDFLTFLLKNYNGRRVMIIGHRATQYALEHFVCGRSYEEIISAPWSWQPGWSYQLKEIR